MSMLEEIDQHIKDAMRSKDAIRLSTMRLIKSELKKAILTENVDLTDAMAQKILQRMAKQHKDSIEQFRKGNRRDLAEKEEAELVIVESFLPAPIAMEQIDAIIEETLAAIGEIDPEKAGMVIGKVVGAVKATGLSFDGSVVSERVRRRLTS